MSTTEKSPLIIREKKRTVYDVHDLWCLFTQHKRWFALSFILCLCCAAAYIYFASPAYSVSGKMLITEKKSSSTSSAANILLQSQLPFNLGSNLGGAIGVENEKEILKSKILACQVVNELGLYTEYRHYKYFKGRLLYKNQPVNVSASQELLDFMDDNLPMKLYKITLSIYKNSNGYRIKGSLIENKTESDIPEQAFATLPAVIKTRIGQLTLTENKSLTPQQASLFSESYREDVEIIPPITAAMLFSKEVSVASASKKALNTLNLTIRDENILRGIDYINMLVVAYNNYSTSEKHREVSRYDEYVKERLAKVDSDLGVKDEDWESFKKQNKVMDLKVDAEEVIKKKSEYEAQLVGIGIQKQLLDYLKEYIDDPANSYEIIPVNMGVFARSSVSSSVTSTVDVAPSSVSMGDAVNIISRHNALVTERSLLLKSSTEKSPQVKQLTDMIDELHPIIQKALARDIKALEVRREGLEKEYDRYLGRVGSAPQQERVLTEITRDRKVKEGVYLSLLQKREENAMDMINTVDKGRLIDMVQYNKKVRPRPLIVLFLALFMGGLFPFLYIALCRWLKGTIDSIDDLKDITKLPILGEIPQEGIQTNEAFISVRSNLLHQLGHQHKVVLVTSNDEGEGKTYHSIQLAKSLSEMGKHVVLCDLNLRHSSVAKELGIQQRVGLSQLLIRNDVTKEAIISTLVKTASSHFDVLVAGEMQNVHPANLIGRENLWTVMNALKQDYDYLILDTPAIGKFNDVLIDGLGDVAYFVCQSGRTPNTSIMHLNQLAEEGRLSNPCIVINHL